MDSIQRLATLITLQMDGLLGQNQDAGMRSAAAMEQERYTFLTSDWPWRKLILRHILVVTIAVHKKTKRTKQKTILINV